VCGKAPEEIEEYCLMAGLHEMDPDEYVWSEEETLNRKTGQFVCTVDYFGIGMPTSPGGWMVPDEGLDA
jgi:hypothetical protein